MHLSGDGPGYRITSGARYYCHLRRRISIAWALRYRITSGARIGGELSKREGVLFHWWPFSSKRNDRLQLFYTDITLM